MVMMCSAWVALIRSMMAAKVEDFPDPAGPVTKTMPVLSIAIFFSSGGSISSSNVGILLGIIRMTMAYVPRCRKMLVRKRLT